MGSSISSAMHYIDKKEFYFDAVLIALADQPLIDVKYFNNLINFFLSDNYDIVASNDKDRVGVPAIFSSKYINLLSKLELDFGARKIIMENKNNLKVVGGEGKLLDIDTISDYNKFFQKYGKV